MATERDRGETRAGIDRYARAGPPWTIEAFLKSISSAEDRAQAQFIFDQIEVERSAGAYFWLGECPKALGPPWSRNPEGGIFPHIGGLHYAPMSLLVNKSGVLEGRGAWTRYRPNPSGHDDSECRMPQCGWRIGGCQHDDGFAELAKFVDQDHLGGTSRFLFGAFNIEILWDVAVRTALRVNGRAAEIKDAGHKRPQSQDSSTPTGSVQGDETTDDPDDALYRRKFGRDLTYAEKKAVEKRAVEVTRRHFEDVLGYTTEDVGDSHSYDIRARKDEQTVRIEVKGTITSGSIVKLTWREVELHEAEHPNNAFALVRKIVLKGDVDPPVATGGELVPVEMPWKIDRTRLTPTEYRYLTGY